MINLYSTTITNIEKRAVNEALNTNFQVLLNLLLILRINFSQKYKLKYCLSTNSGTSALHLTLLSLGMEKAMKLSFLH